MTPKSRTEQLNILRNKIKVSQKQVLPPQNKGNSHFYLFCSFDLTNSTAYKSRYPENWLEKYDAFFNDVKRVLVKNQYNQSNKFSIWKYVGDEVLLKKEVLSLSDVLSAPSEVYDAFKECINALRGKEKPHLLSIKATLWLAKLHERKQNLDSPDSTKNIIINLSEMPHESNKDFLGSDIDLGFRISKFSSRGCLAVSANIAYILLHKKDKIKDQFGYDPNQFLKIVAYESLKGIWDERKYPIIWFDRDWETDKMFLYDEGYGSGIIKNIQFTKLKGATARLSYLDKILLDTGKNDEYANLLKEITDLKEPQEKVRVVAKSY